VPIAPPRGRAIPLWVKLCYTGFVLVLVPYYWRAYGPTNFLYFCDMALFLTLFALWRESALVASMATIAILVPQLLWMVDFVSSIFGLPITGMTAYMFSPTIPLFTRALSFFHFWLPLFLVWIVWRLGYDRRALAIWTVCAWGLVLVCYFFLPAPPPPPDNPNLPVNVNYVYGPSDAHPQEWMHPLAYLALLLIGLPLLFYWPAHWSLRKLVRPA